MQEGVIRPAQEQAAQRGAFERDLIAQRADLVRQQQQAGQTAIGTLLGVQQQGEIAASANKMEEWKTLRAEELTKQGWTHDEAMAQADREWQSGEKGLDRELNWAVAQGEIKMEEKKLVENARQFNTQQDFNKWALEQGWNQDAIDRAWKTSERIASQEFTATEATLDRQLQKDIADGNITVEMAKLAQQASQFNTQLEWEKEATRLGLDMETAKMAWQTSENNIGRAFTLQMATVQHQFDIQGISLTAVMSYIQDMDPIQAATILNDLAIDAGLTYTDDNGNEVAGIRPIVQRQQGTGAVGTFAGLDLQTIGNLGTMLGINTYGGQPTAQQASDIETAINTAATAYQAGQPITGTQAKVLVEATRAGLNTGVQLATALPANNVVSRVGEGGAGYQRWALSAEAKTWAEQNQGGLYVSPTGAVYKVVGSWDPPDEMSHRNEAGYITFQDMDSGKTYNLSTGWINTPDNGSSLVKSLP
jgi:hypothetical protein